jgi:hypothetical protein
MYVVAVTVGQHGSSVYKLDMMRRSDCCTGAHNGTSLGNLGGVRVG